jgi:uncharacterized phage-associated protein
MPLLFDEAKATQAAAKFLELRGGEMHYLKLIKLLYLVDRTALLRWGIPVTTDRYVSMDHGPVLSRVYSLVVDEVPKPVWAEYISAPNEYQVRLNRKAPTDKLSRAEERLIEEIHQQYGHWNRWRLVDYLHTQPESPDPTHSTIPITERDILNPGGEDEAEIKATIHEIESMSAAKDSLSNIV